MDGKSLAVAIFCAAAGMAVAQPPAGQPWMNTALTADARADLVQAQMTRDEELTLVHGFLGTAFAPGFRGNIPNWIRPYLPGSAGFVPGIPRLGIPPLNESDASLGVANGNHMRPGDTAVALPSSILTAASWNTDVAYAGGAMIGSEARNKGFNVLLAGGINLMREPRNGRTFEYSGEDPLLAGVLVGASIRGIQDQHIISTIKHFALNDQETARTVMSSDIADADARESDLLAFEIAIEHGDPGAVMCSYNRLNRVYACENNYLLNEVLKQDWAYRGFVLSDWGAVHSTVDSANHGLDQESANGFDSQDFFGEPLKQAVALGAVTPTRLHDMVHRILRSMFAKGLVDHPPGKRPIDLDSDLMVAQRAAEEGIVLLKNANNLLPLPVKPKHRQTIALIGGRADTGVFSGGGSSQVIPIGDSQSSEILMGGAVTVIQGQPWQIPKQTIVLDPPAPLDAIREESGNARVRYDDGDDIASAVDLAKKSDVAIVFARQWMREGIDASDLLLFGNQNDLIEAVAETNPNTIVILETGGPVVMPWLDKVSAVLEAWYPGNRGANAIARILFGAVNPSGRLPVTFPAAESQLPRPIITGQNPIGRTIATYGTPTAYDVIYSEGPNVGYKWFEQQRTEPLFPFGFGLSYTTFAYDGLKITGGRTISASFDIHNLGDRAGKATAQVYVKPPVGASRLIGWSKVDLGPGETKHATVTADPRLLALFDSDANLWRVEDGDYRVTIGGSFADKAAAAVVHVTESTIRP
ncbi:MAG: glycoside hydrolase family 3 C-terminal domain-containing protein [Alphaproteobacteria bacterium]|nr:glycoside hydrolase family 3 C-terminal domain-containing protein [Alphaproteobacteria bacterium]